VRWLQRAHQRLFQEPSFVPSHAKLENTNALFVPTPKPTKMDYVSTDLSRRLIRRSSTKETKVVVGDSLGRDNVEPSAPASSTSLQGSSNRSIPGSGCTPRGGFKVAPRAPANGDGNVLFITPCSRSLPLLPLKPEIGSTCWSCCGVIFRGLDEHSDKGRSQTTMVALQRLKIRLMQIVQPIQDGLDRSREMFQPILSFVYRGRV